MKLIKSALVVLATTTLLAPVGALVSAGPASADNDVVHVKLDPASGWTWSGTLNVFDQYKGVASKDFTFGPGGGPQDVIDITVATWMNYDYLIFGTFTGGGVTRNAHSRTSVHDPQLGDLYIYSSYTAESDIDLVAKLTKVSSDNYELVLSPSTNAPSLQNLNASVAAAFDGGRGCTVKGTAGDDVLKGTSGDDVICGFGGNDTIHGKGGDDVIHAGRGHDTVHGGSGHDTIVGGKGNDTIHGGKGADDISGGKGKDTIHHTKGHDWVHGGPHKDKLIDIGGRP